MGLFDSPSAEQVAASNRRELAQATEVARTVDADQLRRMAAASWSLAGPAVPIPGLMSAAGASHYRAIAAIYEAELVRRGESLPSFRGH